MRSAISPPGSAHRARHSPAGPRPIEFAVPAIATIVLIAASALVSARKHFWNDELYSHYLLADPSFAGMLAAFHDAINTTPPLYFVLGWLWARPFGADELSLRLFSSVAICAALWLTWLTLRRVHGFWPASIGTLAVFCTSGLILEHNAEARMYGLFLLVGAAATLLYQRAVHDGVPSRRIALVTFCVHAALVLTHLLGPLYSAGFLIALVMSDARAGVIRPRAYLPIVASWFTFVLYVPAFIAQADAGIPRSWLPAPVLADLLGFMTLSTGGLLQPTAIVLVLLAGVLYRLARTPARPTPSTVAAEPAPRPSPHDGRDSQLLLLAFVLIAMPVIVFAVSRLARPIFLDRYMIISTIGWAILLAHVTAALAASGASQERQRPARRIATALIPATVMLVLLVRPLSVAWNHPRSQRPGSIDGAFGYTKLPIVVQASHQFLQRQHDAAQPERYVFILDWDAAVAEASGPFGPQEYKHLEAIRRNYSDRLAGRILTGEEFLREHRRFLVLDHRDFDRRCPPRVEGLSRWEDIHCPQWVERRILGDPAFDVAVLGAVGEGIMLLVEPSLTP